MSLPHPRIAEEDGVDEPADGGPSDIELIAAVRAGSTTAYGRLYERHLAAVRRLARYLSRSPAEVDDLVSEAFAKVLQTLRDGGGPDTAFRSYLLTTVRNTFYDRIRRDRRLELSDDMSRHDAGVPWEDPAMADLESALAARAFARLPERWQTVLWHTEVEQESPAELAELLGMTPNGVAALAYRAREGLRQAYLREHVAGGATDRCRWTIDRLGGWARSTLSRREQVKVDAHLLSCDRCRPLAAELRHVNGSLRGIVAPAILGMSAAAYGAAVAAETAPAAAAAGLAGGAALTAGGATAGGAAGGATAGTGTAATGTAAGTAATGTAATGTVGGTAATGTAATGTAATGTAATGSAAGTAATGTAAGTAATGSAAGAAATGTAAGAAATGTAAGTAATGTAAGAAATGTAAGAAATGTAAGTAATGTAAGTAATGTAAATAATGTAAVTAAAGTAAGGGSVVSGVAGWVAGTVAGKAAAAVVTALVVGGTAVGISATHHPGDAAPTAAAPGTGQILDVAATSPGAPATGTGPGDPAATSPAAGDPYVPPGLGTALDPTAKPSGPGGAAPLTGAPSGAPGGPGGAGAPSAPAGTGRPPAPPGSPTADPVPGTGRPELRAGSPAAVRPLRQGKSGEITVPIGNPGTAAARDVVATIAVPAGFEIRPGGSVRGGGSAEPDGGTGPDAFAKPGGGAEPDAVAEPAGGTGPDALTKPDGSGKPAAGAVPGKAARPGGPPAWTCTSTGTVATCRVAELPAGETGTVRLKVALARTAADGAVTGTVVAAGGLTADLPTVVLQVEPR